MVDIIECSRIRYPPFESSLKNPQHLPIIENEVVVAEGVEDVESYLEKLPAPTKIGDENNWLVERKLFSIDDGGKRNIIPHFSSLDEREFPSIVERQRVGWYLTPNPIHARARKVITIAVTLLLIALFYQTLEPVLEWLEIIEKPIGSIQIGLLDYPFLIVFVLPFMIFPLLLRVGANLVDLQSQKKFLSNQLEPPTINFSAPPCSDQPLSGEISIDKPLDDWQSLSLKWRVGVLPPSREDALASLGISEGGQPPPGFSTTLPHYWEAGLSDGTGVGEETPMEHHDIRGGLFLRPMRISENGGKQKLPLQGGKFELTPPSSSWSGTQAGSLVRIHWELQVKIGRLHNRPLYWLLPLRVRSGNGPFEISEILIRDGRSEEKW